MTDPRDLSPDQRELLDACEQVALLPRPLVEADFDDAANVALDLFEQRGLAFRDDDNLTIEPLAKHAAGLRREGHLLAADGVRLMIMVWLAGVEVRAAEAADNN